MESCEGIWELDTDTLQALWEGRPTSLDVEQLPEDWKREAFWSYWKRVADGERELDPALLTKALESDIDGIGNVIGTLAMNDRLGSFDRTSLRRCLHALDTEDATWGLAQLDARDAAELLARPEVEHRSLLLEFLLVKGVFFTLLSAVDVLTPEEREYVREVMDRRKVLTRSQRHSIRERIKALSPERSRRS